MPLREKREKGKQEGKGWNKLCSASVGYSWDIRLELEQWAMLVLAGDGDTGVKPIEWFPRGSLDC